VNSESDSALMKRVQAGETWQLALLFERYHVALFRYVLGLTGDRALSEDLVQEVFFRVIKYARSYDPNLSFRVWLYGMARNAHFDTRHKRRHEVPDHPMQEIESSEPMPDEILSRKQNAKLLQKALLRLSPERREVLILSRFHNLRYEEIGSILKCEAGAVKVRVYRALKDLREKFAQLCGEKVYDA
jgi:RNA polymerase sigma factor (sigma-70 family)